MDLQQILETTLPGMGYELVDVELTAQGILRVFIDKEGGITVEDCATVSNHLSRVFMVEDVDYKHLEISSPGLDRPLKKAADFVRFTGSMVKLKTRLPVDGQKNFIGRIESFDEAAQTIVLAFDGKTAQIELSNVDKARIKPEFKFSCAAQTHSESTAGVFLKPKSSLHPLSKETEKARSIAHES